MFLGQNKVVSLREIIVTMPKVSHVYRKEKKSG